MALPNNSYSIDPATNYVIPVNLGTWGNLSGRTWDSWKHWQDLRANSMTVIGTVRDREVTGWFNLKTDCDVTGNISYSVYTSNSGAFAGEETVSNITPNTGNLSAFYGRYYTVVTTVTDPSGEIELRRLDITDTNSRFDIQFNDVSTDALNTLPTDSTSRILPLPRTIGAVTNMQVTAHNPTVNQSIYATTGTTGYILNYDSSVRTTVSTTIPLILGYTSYVMMATKEAPYNYIFKTTDGDSFANLTVVGNTGGFYGESVAWNHDSTRVTFGLQSPSSNNIRTYTRASDTFTKASDPNTWPAGGVNDLAWTNTDDDYLAVAHTNSPYMSYYAGTNYNKAGNPATLPTGSAYAIAWSPADDYLAVGHATSPYITIYSRSGSTLTKVTDPASLPTDTVTELAWSPDGNYLVVSYAQTFKIYYNASGTFVAISNPSIVPQISSPAIYTFDFNTSGNAMAIGWSANLTDTSQTTNFGVYRIAGNTWTWANSAATSITGAFGVYDIEWMASGTQILVAHHNTQSAGTGVKVYNFGYSGNVTSLATGLTSSVGNVYAVGSSEPVQNTWITAANVTGFPASGNIRVRNETMSYTSANTITNRFEGITRAVTTAEFGNSTANIHPAGSEIFSISSIDFTAKYFETQVVGIANAYVLEKDRTQPTIVIRDGDGNYTDGVVDAVIWALPEQYMDDTNLGTR